MGEGGPRVLVKELKSICENILKALGALCLTEVFEEFQLSYARNESSADPVEARQSIFKPTETSDLCRQEV